MRLGDLEQFTIRASADNAPLLLDPTADPESVLPENLYCVGPFWLEHWQDLDKQERFSIEGWLTDVGSQVQKLFGQLWRIHSDRGLPSKLRASAEELYRADAAGAEPLLVPSVPCAGDTNAPQDLQEAAVYYLTPRGQQANAQNKMLMNGLGGWAAFDAFDLVDILLTQPLMVVAGSAAGSLWHSEELYAKAPGKKEMFLVESARHMDLYDGEGATPAMGKFAPFFKANL